MTSVLSGLNLKHPSPPESVRQVKLHPPSHVPAFDPNRSPGSVAIITHPPGHEVLMQPMPRPAVPRSAVPPVRASSILTLQQAICPSSGQQAFNPTGSPWQMLVPGGQDSHWQAEGLKACPWGQRLGTHRLPHSMVPLGQSDSHWQVDGFKTSPSGQASDTHASPHSTVLLGQLQPQPWHTLPPVQALPQKPQFEESLQRSEHCPPQQVSFCEHWIKHPPQWELLLCVLTHVPRQLTNPVGHRPLAGLGAAKASTPGTMASTLPNNAPPIHRTAWRREMLPLASPRARLSR